MSKKKIKKEKEFVVPNGKHPVFKFVRPILRLFFKKPQRIVTDCEIAPGSIMVCNHSAKKGPMTLELYRENYYVPWGAHPMLGGYRSRYGYLRNVFYIQKKGYSPILATPLAAFESLFSIYFYKAMRILPTYQDSRLLKTVNNSISCMENGVSVLIFPENSDKGYMDVMTEFHPGFVLLAQGYARRHPKEDRSIYPMYYHNKSHKLIIGKPVSIATMNEMGLDKKEFAEYFRLQVNALYYEHILGTPIEKIPTAEGTLAEKIAIYHATKAQEASKEMKNA